MFFAGCSSFNPSLHSEKANSASLQQTLADEADVINSCFFLFPFPALLNALPNHRNTLFLLISQSLWVPLQLKSKV